MRIKTNILITALILLIINFGLIIKIDNNILSISYLLCIMLLSNIIRKRKGIIL